MELEQVDVANRDVFVLTPDLRRDIHIFVDYARCRDVKRAHRNNALAKSDAKRLAKLMTDRDAAVKVQESGWSKWIDFVDETALNLGLVAYDTQGEYAGYTSAEPCFPDNYVEVSEKNYKRFLAMTPAQQELQLLDTMLDKGPVNGCEFFGNSLFGRLDRFSGYGSAIGVVPTLDFPAVRRFLLNVLANCPTGVWLSTSSLVQYLKAKHPYFLIPKKPRIEKNRRNYEGRYGNFQEGKQRWGHDIAIGEKDEDAFERVEGRYVERFLEGIPLLLKYVDVAYAQRRPKAIYPSIGCLPAFRVNDRLARALAGKIALPQLTVAPNFEVYLQSDIYPAATLAELAPLCQLVSEDTTIVLKLTKQNVAAARAEDPKLDVNALLQQLSDTPLPANVTRELSDWADHGEKFVLYKNCAVLESTLDLKAADPFTVEQVAPKIRLVRSAKKLFQALEQQELAPLRVEHGDDKLSSIPKGVSTCFRKRATRTKSRGPKAKVTLLRVTRIQLVCPNREFLDQLAETLKDAKCPVEVDRKNLTIIYANKHAADVTKAIKLLQKEYDVKIEDAG